MTVKLFYKTVTSSPVASKLEERINSLSTEDFKAVKLFCMIL